MAGLVGVDGRQVDKAGRRRREWRSDRGPAGSRTTSRAAGVKLADALDALDGDKPPGRRSLTRGPRRAASLTACAGRVIALDVVAMGSLTGALRQR